MHFSADISADLRTDAWCPGGPGIFRTDFAIDGPPPYVPLELADVVWPLTDWLEALHGEVSEIDGFTDAWIGAAQSITALQDGLAEIAEKVSVLEGHGANALRARLQSTRVLLNEAADWTQATAVALGQAHQIVAAVRAGLVGAVSELVALGATLRTPENWDLNPLDTANSALTAHAQNYVELMGGLIAAMFDSFETLLTTIDELEPHINDLIKDVRTALGVTASEFPREG